MNCDGNIPLIGGFLYKGEAILKAWPWHDDATYEIKPRGWFHATNCLSRKASWQQKKHTALTTSILCQLCVVHTMTLSNVNISALLTFCAGNSPCVTVNYPHKSQWRGAFIYIYILSAPWITGWVNNREAGDLRRHRAHYDVIMMTREIRTYWFDAEFDVVSHRRNNQNSFFEMVTVWRNLLVDGIIHKDPFQYSLRSSSSCTKHTWFKYRFVHDLL